MSKFIRFFSSLIPARIWLPGLLVCSACHSYAQSDLVADVDQLKVAFAYNFSKYFSWPPEVVADARNEASNFIICIDNSAVANGEFSKLTGQLTQSRRIEVRTTPGLASEIGTQCHMWFLDAKSFNDNQLLLEQTNNSPVLVVSDAPGSRNNGAVIELAVINNRIQFRINMDLMQEKNLSASAFLLRLAQ